MTAKDTIIKGSWSEDCVQNKTAMVRVALYLFCLSLEASDLCVNQVYQGVRPGGLELLQIVLLAFRLSHDLYSDFGHSPFNVSSHLNSMLSLIPSWFGCNSKAKVVMGDFAQTSHSDASRLELCLSTFYGGASFFRVQQERNVSRDTWVAGVAC